MKDATENAIVTEVSSGLPKSTSSAQMAEAIRERTIEMIRGASLTQVESRLPQYVGVVTAMIEEMTIKDPLTLARVGSWALNEQAEAGLALLSAVQQGPSHEALIAVDAFEAALRARIKPLEERLKLRRERERERERDAPKSVWKQDILKVLASLTKSKEDKRTEQSLGLRTEIQSLNEDAVLLGKVVQETVAAAVKMKTLLVQCKDVPALIQEQVTEAMEAHGAAAEKLYLSLVAVNEFQRDLTDTQIPQLEQKAASDTAPAGDADDLQLARDAVGLLETRRTDLTAALLNTLLQRGMTAEMGKINADSALEMERLESIALPQMLTMLGGLALQQRTSEIITAARSANQILGDTTKATADGFAKVLELSRAADDAKLDAAKSVVAATTETLTAMKAFREHEATHIEKQRDVQGQLAEAIGNLRVAAVRIGNPDPKTQAALFNNGAAQEATNKIAEIATGVSLPVLREQQALGEAALPEGEGGVEEAKPKLPKANTPADLFKKANTLKPEK